MATLVHGGFPTIAEVASRLDPNGDLAIVANVLERKMGLLRDMPWFEGNLTTGHQVARAENALPSATWRQINQGVLPTTGQVGQYTETFGLLEDECVIDEELLKLNGGMEYRVSEEVLKKEGIAQQLGTAVFYESASVNPERIHGLSPRFYSTTAGLAQDYVLKGTNAGSNCHSIWLLTWAPRKLYGGYPKGTKAGLERVDNGRQRITDSQGRAFYAYSTSYKWRCGVVVEDYRYAVRIQWDPDDSDMASTGKGLYLLLQDALSQIYEVTPDTRLYMNRTSLQRLNRQLLTNENRPLDYLAVKGKRMGDPDQGGESLPHFFGVPIRLDDSLVAETAI